MSRRKRLSERTAQEIKDIARRLMAEQGTAGLSIRAIAREIEMTPPAIYTYYPSLDDLITALIVDAFTDYAESLAEVRKQYIEAGKPLEQQLLAIMKTYRTWAIEHPAQFMLIYGSPIPGYHAPSEVTRPAVLRMGVIFVELLTELRQTGSWSMPDRSAPIPPTVADYLREQVGEDAQENMIYTLYELYSHWMSLHGMVTLEVFGHLQGTVGDPEAFFNDQVKRIFLQIGVKL